MVEKLLPATVALLAEMDMYKWIVSWLDGLLNECHTGFLRSSAAFFDVALGTGTYYIPPNCLAANTSGDNMVE